MSETPAPPTPPTPRPAGTVVLARDAQGGLEVLMVRRGKRAAFMADAFVFPGGRVDADDGDAAGAAAREAFEEAGVLLAAPVGGGDIVSTDGADAAWMVEARGASSAKSARLADSLASHGLRLATEGLVCFARWVTPSQEPRRFDAHFFLSRMPAGQTPLSDEVEVSEHRWERPATLVVEAQAGTLKLPPPTQWHLNDLSRFTTVDEALAWARGLTVTTVCPKLGMVDEGLAVVLPWDRDFASLPGDEPPAPPPDGAESSPVTRYLLVDGRWLPRRVSV